MKTDSKSLKPYLEAEWNIIPLCRYDKQSLIKGRLVARGKSPMQKEWRTLKYSPTKVAKHLANGNNVGVRLTLMQLVVDVDPRNFKEGDDPFKRLCKDVGLIPNKYAVVKTGGGGLHIYMHKPRDLKVVGKLNEYPGVEFKSHGRQVVAAGSIHPDTLKLYKWDVFSKPLKNTPDAPEALLDLLEQAASAIDTSGKGGEYSKEQLAKMLVSMKPESFRDQDDWFTLLLACYDATNGTGMDEFITWSTSDPQFADHAGIIEERWNSLSGESATGNKITHRTLDKFVIDHGDSSTIPLDATEIEDDFKEPILELPKEKVPDNKYVDPNTLQGFNEKYWAVMDNGAFKVYWEEYDPETEIYRFDKVSGEYVLAVKGRNRWVRAKGSDFSALHANKKIRISKEDKVIPLAGAWLQWTKRRTARGVIFDPARDHEGYLNLWTGWGVDADKDAGTWNYLKELLTDVICDGDEDVYKYVMDWAAYMVQYPGAPAEVAICFQGGKGVGKGTWGRALASLAGKHGMQITSSDQLTGRFNDHMRDLIFLFADEALKPYDKEGESRLKGLITEPRIAFEGKGRDVVSGKNHLHIMMASNEDWFVPAGLEGERRFMVQRANNSKVGKIRFFSKLNDELRRGGLQSLLYDLMNRDIKGYKPRINIPITTAYVNQKLLNMNPVQQWWINLLSEGHIPFDLVDNTKQWYKEEVLVFQGSLKPSYEEHCRINGIRTPGSMGKAVDMQFLKQVGELLPSGTRNRVKVKVPDDMFEIEAHGDGRAWALPLPPLQECRELIEAKLGLEIDWQEMG